MNHIHVTFTPTVSVPVFTSERRGVLSTVGKKARIKTIPSVAVHCCGRNPMGLLSGRFGLKKLAFLQERDNWLSAASAK